AGRCRRPHGRARRNAPPPGTLPRSRRRGAGRSERSSRGRRTPRAALAPAAWWSRAHRSVAEPPVACGECSARPRVERTRGSERLLAKRLVEILDQIIHVLEADGNAEQVLGRPRPRSLDGGTMLYEALRAAQAGRTRHEAKASGDRHRLR